MKSYILIADLIIKGKPSIGTVAPDITIPQDTIVNGEIDNASKLLVFTYKGEKYSVDTKTQVDYFKLYSYTPVITLTKYKLKTDLTLQPVGDKKIAVKIPKDTVVEATISTKSEVAPCQIPPCPYFKADYLTFTFNKQQFTALKSNFTETTETVTSGSELSNAASSAASIKPFPIFKTLFVMTVGAFAIYGLFQLAKKI